MVMILSQSTQKITLKLEYSRRNLIYFSRMLMFSSPTRIHRTRAISANNRTFVSAMNTHELRSHRRIFWKPRSNALITDQWKRRKRIQALQQLRVPFSGKATGPNLDIVSTKPHKDAIPVSMRSKDFIQQHQCRPTRNFLQDLSLVSTRYRPSLIA